MQKQEKIVVTIFVIILIGFFAADLMTPVKSFSPFENRKLMQRPAFNLKSVADGSFMQDFETYVSDQFVGRNRWIGLKTMTDIMLGQKEINGIYLATDGTLIEKHTEEFTEENIQKTISKLQILESMLQGRCGHFQVLLAPTADNVYVHKLPKYADVYAQEALLERIRQSCQNAEFVNVFACLRSHAQESVYYGTDHHWTSLGAYYAYEVWAKNLGVQPVSCRMHAVSEQFFGTLHSATNLSFLSPDTIEAYDYEGQREVYYDFSSEFTTSLYAEKFLNTKNQYGYFLDDNHSFVEIHAAGRGGETKKGISLFIIKDSFANCMIPLLSEHYDTVYVVDLRYYKGKLASLVDTYVTNDTDVLILYNMAHFVEEFRFY